MSKKTSNIFEYIRGFPESKNFHNNTKIRDFNTLKITPYHNWPATWKRIYYKAYPRLDQVLLPNPTDQKFYLHKALLERVSYRRFSKGPIKLRELSDLLYYSAGIKDIFNKKDSPKRFYPSAGARYPLEVYPFVFRVEGLKSAVYHYHLKTHSLELILNKPFYNQTLRQFKQPWIRRSAVLLIVSAIFDRTENKYGDRGYRHVLTEYGHVAQNLYLVSTALSLGCCSIGGFIDGGLNELLDIDGIDESAIGVVAIGNKVK